MDDLATTDGGITYTGGGNDLGQLIPDNTKPGIGYSTKFGASDVNIGNLSITLYATGNAIPTGGSGTLMGAHVSYGNIATFNGMSAGGDGMVLFADLSAGDKSTWNSFSLAVTAVPEPVNVALSLFGLVLPGGLAWKRWRGDPGKLS